MLLRSVFARTCVILEFQQTAAWFQIRLYSCTAMPTCSGIAYGCSWSKRSDAVLTEIRPYSLKAWNIRYSQALRHLLTSVLTRSEWFPSLGPVELRPWVPWGFGLDFFSVVASPLKEESPQRRPPSSILSGFSCPVVSPHVIWDHVLSPVRPKQPSG